MSESNLPVYSSKSFRVASLTFRSLIHFEVNFVFGIRVFSDFILFTWSCPVFPAPPIEETLLSIVYYFLLFHRSIDHMYVDIYLVFLSGSIHLYLILCQYCIVLISEIHSDISNSLQPHGLYIHGILQARILESVAVPFSGASSQSRNQAQVPAFQADSLSAESPGKPG